MLGYPPTPPPIPPGTLTADRPTYLPPPPDPKSFRTRLGVNIRTGRPPCICDSGWMHGWSRAGRGVDTAKTRQLSANCCWLRAVFVG